MVLAKVGQVQATPVRHAHAIPSTLEDSDKSVCRARQGRQQRETVLQSVVRTSYCSGCQLRMCPAVVPHAMSDVAFFGCGNHVLLK